MKIFAADCLNIAVAENLDFSQTPINILLVEDQKHFALALQSDVTRKAKFPCEFKVVGWLKDALEYLESATPDVVLADLTLPDSSGLATLSSMRTKAKNIPIIVLTGIEDEQLALEAIKLGAQDYILKGQIDGKVVATAIAYAMERVKLRAQVDELARQRDDFMAVVSHDLKNNLIGLNSVAGHLLSDSKGIVSPEQQRLLGLMKRCAVDSLLMTEDLLRLYRHQAHEDCLYMAQHDLNNLAQKAVNSIKEYASTKDVQIEFQTSAEHMQANCDRTAMLHILTNLLHNAIKFSPEGQPIQLSTQRLDGMIVIKVINQGDVIPEHVRSKLFTGSVASTQRDAIHGSGLGLFLSYRLIRLQQGNLSCTSDPTTGTIFIITLPLVPQNSELVPQET